MSPDHHPSCGQPSAAEIERWAAQLPRARETPAIGGLERVCGSPGAGGAVDLLNWSVWRHKQSRQVWVHCTGGLAGVDAWFGPGDPSLASAPARE